VHLFELTVFITIYILMSLGFLWLIWKIAWPLIRAIVFLLGGVSYGLVSGVIVFLVVLFKTIQRGDPEKRWRVIKTLEEMNAELDEKNARANNDFFLKESLKQERK
jgi:ABC-type multidrug transport system fused ATPase/permease subunit